MNKTIYLTLQNSIRQMLALLLFVVLARYLTVEDFGKYQQLYLIIGIFAVIFSMGIPVAVSYFHGQTGSYTGKVSVYKRFFLSQLLLITAGAAFFYLIKEILSHFFQNDYFSIFIIWLCIIMLSNASLEFFRNLSVVTDRLKWFLVVTSLVQLVNILINIIIVIKTENILFVLINTSVFNTLQFLLLTRKNLKYFFSSVPWAVVNKIESKYILAMGSVALIGVANGFVDQIMVSLMLTTADYANLRIGAFQIPFIGIITGSLLTVMIPVISKSYKSRDFKTITETWALSIEKATVLLVPIVIFCLIFAQEIIIGFFGTQYESAVIIFQAYMFQWLRAVVIFGGVMGAIGLEQKLFQNTVLITIMNFVLNYFMILKFGVIGAAISTTLLNYFGGYLLIRQIDKQLGYRFFSYFPMRIYLIALFLSVVFCSIMKTLTAGLLSNVAGLILVSITFYAVILLTQMQIFYRDVSYKRLRWLI